VSGDFIWRDAGRTVVFRRGGIAQAPELLGEHGFDGFALLATERSLGGAEALRGAAASVHEVAAGQVPDLAAAMLEEAGEGPLVALGGGRVIDVAKAVAAITGGEVAAIPTTMSGAEMTGIHRLPAGAETRARRLVRPSFVLAEPEAMTGQPEAALRASSMNALAHGIDSLCTPYANPVSVMTALRGAELIASALDQDRERRQVSDLALGSLLCGYAIDSGAFSVHHVVCQTLVRVCGSPHAETNAAILPRSAALLASRAPDRLAVLARSLGAELADLEPRILELGGNPPGIGAAGADRAKLAEALEAMLARPELAFMPDPPDRAELADLIEAAW
jgi:alcohol dehydrogenase class IV